MIEQVSTSLNCALYTYNLHVINTAIGMMASNTVILIRLNFAALFIILLIWCVLEKKDDNITDPPNIINHVLALQAAPIPSIVVLLGSKSRGIIDNKESIVPAQIK